MFDYFKVIVALEPPAAAPGDGQLLREWTGFRYDI